MSHAAISGQEKYRNYKEQFDRLNKALKNEFYLEAIFIEYAILEDRTESVLRHARLWESYMKGKKMANIGTKLTFIKNKANVKSCTLHPYFNSTLMDDLRDWKNKRNPLIHDLLNQKLGDEDLKNLATEGSKLVRILRTQATKHNREADKKFGELSR
jgi:hypothetical protein